MIPRQRPDASSALPEPRRPLLAERHHSLEEISAVGKAPLRGGLALQHLVRTNLYLTDYADFGLVNDVYARRLSAPYPARTSLQVAALPLGAAVQVDAVVAFS